VGALVVLRSPEPHAHDLGADFLQSRARLAQVDDQVGPEGLDGFDEMTRACSGMAANVGSNTPQCAGFSQQIRRMLVGDLDEFFRRLQVCLNSSEIWEVLLVLPGSLRGKQSRLQCSHSVLEIDIEPL